MNAINLAFALAKRHPWHLCRRADGVIVAHRPYREYANRVQEEMTLEWPTDSSDIPEETRREFTAALAEWRAGVSAETVQLEKPDVR